jgi:hypothetical protein
MPEMALLPKPKLWRTVIVLGGFVLLVAIFYAEENWRGKHAWESCKRGLEAKGETLDWNKFIPPPVADDQNFFAAPKMQEWFVKPSAGENPTNELVDRLNGILSENDSIVVADLTVEPSTNEIFEGDIDLRYTSFGTATFLSTPLETNMSSPNLTIPLIQFEDVPITTGIEALAKQAGVHYSLDPKIGYNQPDENGQIKPEPTVSLRWENITARQALLAMLNQYDLQLVENSSNASITMKNSDSARTYISPDAKPKVEGVLRSVIGTNVIGSQDLVFFTKSPDEIKPARMVLHSETIPDEKELVALFTQFFPNDGNNSPKIQIRQTGENSFQIAVTACSAKDYLARSHQLESDFDKIREALKRPYARMDGSYSDPITMPIPNYIAVRAVVQTLAQRAQCFLLISQPEKALDELTLMTDSRHLFESAPTRKPMTLVAALLNVAVAGIYVNTVSDGLQLKAWQEPQLILLQKQLAEINLIPPLVEAQKTEPVWFCYWIEMNQQSKVFGSVKQNYKILGLPWPRGWIYQYMANIVKLDRMPLQGFDLTNNIVSSRVLDEVARYTDDFLNQKLPYKSLAASAVPNIWKARQTTAFNQTLVNEAQIACALERYHLAHGDYPETLDALAPQFIETIPHDIIGGQSLHYRRTDDGKFLLYSVGWNETDDDGLDSLQKNKFDYTKGDWVWEN